MQLTVEEKKVQVNTKTEQALSQDSKKKGNRQEKLRMKLQV